MNTPLHLSYGSSTDNGLVNEFNTDSVLEFKILDGHVFVVCDGHNGEQGHGALASKLTTESIKKYFYNRSYKDIIKALTNAISYANFTLFELINKDTKYKGIGSTIATIIYRNGQINYAYAGDSRIYAFKNKQLQPLTRDHVENPAEAKGADVKLLVGRTKDIKFGVCKKPLEVAENDLYLICSDGLTDQLTENEISEILCDGNKAPEHKCQDLIELARKKGGTDCTSVQVLEFSPIPKSPKKLSKINLKNVLIGMLSFAAIVALGFGGLAGYNSLKNKQANRPIIEKQQINISEPDFPIEEQKSNLTPKNIKEVDIDLKTDKPNTTTTKKIDNNISKQSSEPIYHNHKIKFGDNLYRIAIRYNTTQKKLIKINGKKATNLIAGSSIKIPIAHIYKVKHGESLSVVSDKFNMKINKICTASDIDKNNQIKEGQTLIIPLPN